MALPQPVPARTSHPFLTYDMIQEIPDSLASTLERTPSETKRIVSRIDNPDAVLFTGSGTAFHTALLGGQLLRLTSPPFRSQVLEAFELLHYSPHLLSKSLVVGVSHSGITKATVDALGQAREEGASVVGVTHFPDRPIAQVADHTVIAGNGPDLSKCHTKCYLAGALTTTNLVLELVRARDGEPPEEVRTATRQIQELPELARRVIREADEVCTQWAETYLPQTHVYVAGAGPNRVTALEAALKIKETSFLPAEGLETEEVGHGTWVSLNPQSLLVLVAPQGASNDRSVDLARAAGVIGSPVLGIVSEGDERLAAQCDGVVEIPETNEWLSPFLSILPLYLFAYYSSVNREVNPDELRYLDSQYWSARQIVFPPGTH